MSITGLNGQFGRLNKAMQQGKTQECFCFKPKFIQAFWCPALLVLSGLSNVFFS